MAFGRSWCWAFRLLRKRDKCLIIILLTIAFIFLGFRQFLQQFQLQWKETAYNDVSEFIGKSTNFAHSNQLSKDIKIFYKVKINNGWHKNINVITIFNSGITSIFLGNCVLYFCNLKNIYETSNELLKVSHIDGCLYKIEAVSKSLQIHPNQEISLEHRTKIYAASRTDVMPNWFFVGPNNEISLVENTAGEGLRFVSNFTTKDQWKREPGDEYNPYTPEQRYNIIGFDTPEDTPLPVVIPQPLNVMSLDRTKTMTIDKSWSIHGEQGLENEASFIKAFFQILDSGASSKDHKTKRIVLITGDPQVNMGRALDESYALTINTADQFIEIIGKTKTGVFYGIQTLISLADEKGAVPMVTIKDAPRFNYRGMQVDVSRNFMHKEGILRLLDTMSLYKLNKFHFHLSDDEGWRLEIPGLPELTEIGSRMCYDPTELKCLSVQMGADPITSTKPHFYTIQDYQEILQYANKRHIQVIPEFDMPAHCNAAVKSMEARYRTYKNRGNLAAAEEFLLTEFDDTSQYSSIQGYKHNTINPCLNSTYKFITHVIKALRAIHEKHQKLTVYQFGGDEIPTGAWGDSQACLRLISKGEYGTWRDQLKEHFVKRVGAIADSLGLTFGGWDDFFSVKEKIFPKKDVMVWSWNDLPQLGGGKKAYQLAQAGYKVVLAHASHLYFDHPQEPDPEERGFFWATRFTDTRKVFEYIPNFCRTAGQCNDATSENNIYGVTGCLWGETVRTVNQMEYMVFPRLLALAERAWHKAPWEDIQNDIELKTKVVEEWKQFSSFIVKHELRRLEKLGIKYRIPPPGIRFEGKSIKVRTALPGLPVQFSKDEGKSWHDVTDDTQFEENVIVRTSSIDRRRMSRTIEVQAPK